MTGPLQQFDPNCTSCARLARHLGAVKSQFPQYHCAPVAPFGDPRARLLIVGLAPGMHGANATGRPFTGDYAGILLYKTLFRFGLANQPRSESQGDGLELSDCRITNAVKCLPPENKPLGAEINRCNPYLATELREPQLKLALALGRVAHGAVLRALGFKQAAFAFAHNGCHQLNEGFELIDSYHCSRYNTQTRRLTEPMFESVFRQVKERLG